MTAPRRIHVRWGKAGDTRVTYMEERFLPPDGGADYILEDPAALADSDVVQCLIRQAEARGMERADAIVEDLTADWFDPSRRYQSDRIRNAIRAEAAAIKGETT